MQCLEKSTIKKIKRKKLDHRVRSKKSKEKNWIIEFTDVGK